MERSESAGSDGASETDAASRKMTGYRRLPWYAMQLCNMSGRRPRSCKRPQEKKDGIDSVGESRVQSQCVATSRGLSSKHRSWRDDARPSLSLVRRSRGVPSNPALPSHRRFMPSTNNSWSDKSTMIKALGSLFNPSRFQLYRFAASSGLECRRRTCSSLPSGMTVSLNVTSSAHIKQVIRSSLSMSLFNKATYAPDLVAVFTSFTPRIDPGHASHD